MELKGKATLRPYNDDEELGVYHLLLQLLNIVVVIIVTVTTLRYSFSCILADDDDRILIYMFDSICSVLYIPLLPYELYLHVYMYVMSYLEYTFKCIESITISI